MAIRSRLPGNAPASTTHAVPLPADRRNGDRVVVGFVNDVATATATPSAGWNTQPSWTLGQGTSTNHRLTVVTRVIDGSANDALTMTMADGGNGNNVPAEWVAVCMEGDGGLSTGQVQLTGGGNATAGNVTAITGLASGDFDSLIFLGLDNGNGTEHVITPPGTPPNNWGNLTPSSPQAAGAPVLCHSMDRSAAGVTGFSPGQVTWTNQEQWLTAHLVIAAVPVPPAQTVSPSPIAAPTITQQPTVILGFRIRPDAIPAPALPSPTIHPGPVSVVQTGTIPPPPAPPAPMVKHVIRPEFIPSGSVVYEPTVVAGIRPPLRIDFWAVDDDGSLLAPLPKPLAWDLSMIPGEKGAITLEYPRDGINFDILDQRVTRARDLRIRIRTDGLATTALSGILTARDGDEVAESGSVTFYGAFLPALLDEAPLPYNTADERGETTFVDGTAGSILRDVLAIVQADGYLADLTLTFTDTHDSNGNPWTTQTSAKFSPGRTVLQIAQQLKAWGMLEFEVVDTAGGALELRAFDPTAVGTDHTLSDPPIVFRAGRDLLESPHRTDVSQAVTSLLVAGDDGVYVEVDDPTAIAERGRKIGRYISEGNLTTQGAAQAYGLIELARSIHGVDEITHALTFDQNQPAPIRELLPLDWVYSDRRGGLERLRIGQVTVSQRAGTDHYSGAIVLGDLIDSRDVALQRMLDGLAGGQIITGTSEPAPDTDDGKPPAQVQGLQVESGAHQDQGRTFAAVTATWLPVEDNADGSPASDIDYYAIQYRYSGGNLNLPPEWIAVAPVTDTDASWDGVAPGEAIEVRVRAADRWGHVGAWSALELHTTDADTTPPPVPSMPVVSSYLGILTIEWDGLGSAGETQPPDFSHVEIHVSQTSGFTPDRPGPPEDPVEGSTTYIDRLFGAGTMPSTVGDYGQTWFAKLVAVDRSGNPSTASAQDSALLVQAGDGDIGSVSIGKLTAGVMSALMTISGIIRTASSGARVELDTTGLRCYSSAGAILLEFNIPSSALSIIGKLTSGAGVGSGATIVVDPSGPWIRWYPTATAQYIEQRAWVTANPSDGTSTPVWQSRLLNTSGRTDGPDIVQWANGIWQSFRNTAGQRLGGRLFLSRTQARLDVQETSGATTASVVMDSGNTSLNSNNETYISNSAGADIFLLNSGEVQIWNGNTFKAFVIDHPTDPDRWLVHACMEGPTADVVYRGEAEIQGGGAVVELPPYFETATLPEGRQVQLTVQLPDEPVIQKRMRPQRRDERGQARRPVQVEIPEHAMLPHAAASAPRDGRFRIACDGPDGTRVAWMVTAVRADVVPFEVEPLRSEVDVRGGGPYRWIAGAAEHAPEDPDPAG